MVVSPFSHLHIYSFTHLVIFAFSQFRAQRYCFFWTCANKKQKISAKKFRHALKREHFEMLKGTIPKIQKKVLRPVVYQPY